MTTINCEDDADFVVDVPWEVLEEHGFTEDELTLEGELLLSKSEIQEFMDGDAYLNWVQERDEV